MILSAFMNENVELFCATNANLDGTGTEKHAGHLVRYQNQ